MMETYGNRAGDLMGQKGHPNQGTTGFSRFVPFTYWVFRVPGIFDPQPFGCFAGFAFLVIFLIPLAFLKNVFWILLGMSFFRLCNQIPSFTGWLQTPSYLFKVPSTVGKDYTLSQLTEDMLWKGSKATTCHIMLFF